MKKKYKLTAEYISDVAEFLNDVEMNPTNLIITRSDDSSIIFVEFDSELSYKTIIENCKHLDISLYNYLDNKHELLEYTLSKFPDSADAKSQYLNNPIFADIVKDLAFANMDEYKVIWYLYKRLEKQMNGKTNDNKEQITVNFTTPCQQGCNEFNTYKGMFVCKKCGKNYKELKP